ncbi:hypothetical protein ABT061_33280 [Streptosporangium sp. NPDC002544]|uniref:hypothetical protein n=1 Tax=Streptosporangium sp. NPDC002544 TaxID=3154538 RepID=UPI003333533E
MIRRLLPLAVLGLAVLTGCSSQTSLSQTALDQALSQGVAPELIYVVDLLGYKLAEGPSYGGAEGFMAVYSTPDGRQAILSIERGTSEEARCVGAPAKPTEPLETSVSCERDEMGWYRTGGGRHEYMAIRGDHIIRLIGEIGDVDRAALKEAVAGARRVIADGSPTP